MQKKLITIDLDGTTLNEQSQISNKTIDVFQKVQQQGHMIAICTGRPYRLSETFYHQLRLDTPIVNLNGAICHLPAKQQWHNEYQINLQQEIVLAILALKKDFDIQLICAEAKEEVLFDDLTKDFSQFSPDIVPSKQQKVSQLNIEHPADVTALCIFVEKSERVALKDALIKRFCDKINVRIWNGSVSCVEVIPEGVQKAKGVEHLANIYDFEQKDIIAFGDQDNDFEMIQFAGHGVAMHNGITELKNMADDVTENSNDEDGVARYLEKYLHLV